MRQSNQILIALALATPLLTQCRSHEVKSPSTPLRAYKVEVQLDPSKTVQRIPENFLGFSIEKENLNTGDYSPENLILINLYRNLGTGVLRIGADTTDELAFSEYPGVWPSTCAPKRVLEKKRVLESIDFLRTVEWKMIYGLNLGCYDPKAAVVEAQAVTKIAKDRLISFEVGNEPDMFIYRRRRDQSWNTDMFLKQYAPYEQALKQKVPGFRISGPGAGSFVNVDSWLIPFHKRFKTSPFESLSMHFYQMIRTGATPDQPMFASLGHMFSRRYKAYILDQIQRGVLLAHSNGLPFRVSEMNSVALAGTKGLSDSFASALWFVDMAYSFLEIGVEGLNVQGDLRVLNDTYSPMQYEAGQLMAKPIYYGMLLMARSAKGELLKLEYASEANISFFASRDAKGNIHLVYVNKSLEDKVESHFALTGQFQTTVEHIPLRGPSMSATTDILLAGNPIQKDGTWSPNSIEQLHLTGSGLTLVIPPHSAGELVLSPIRTPHGAPQSL